MNDIIITSEMRVGSRWLHYMLADMMMKNVSPEQDAKRLFDTGIDAVKRFFVLGAVAKFHGATYWDLASAFGEFNVKVIALVRNPRDRGVSLTFHNRYHRKHNFKQKEFATDQEAVKWTIMEDVGFHKGNKRQFSHMVPGSYVNNHNGLLEYVWVDYDTFLANTEKCMYNINKILSLGIDENRLINTVHRHAFQNVTMRNNGEEQRNNLWHRKGISKDWVNWFDDEMIQRTEKEFNLYNSYLNLLNGN